MKVLVTGATGFVGNEVVRQLGPAEHAVRVLTRNPNSRQARALSERFSVEVVGGEIGCAASLGNALAGIDAVIHLVGLISEVGATTFEQVHTRGTAQVVQASEQAGVLRFVHMSALGARPQAASRYHRTKWGAEDVVRRSRLAWTIFRPSLIYGPGDHFVNLFARLGRWSPVLPVMGSGSSRLQPVAVEAVARCFVGALTEPGSVGRTIDLCGPERLTFPEILGHILVVTRRRRWLVRVPLPLARAQAAFLEVIFPRLLGRAPPLNRDQLIMLQEDNIGDPAPAQALFDLPTGSFREGIARYLRDR